MGSEWGPYKPIGPKTIIVLLVIFIILAVWFELDAR